MLLSYHFQPVRKPCLEQVIEVQVNEEIRTLRCGCEFGREEVGMIRFIGQYMSLCSKCRTLTYLERFFLAYQVTSIVLFILVLHMHGFIVLQRINKIFKATALLIDSLLVATTFTCSPI